MKKVAIIVAIITAFSCGFVAGENESKCIMQAEYERGYTDALEGKLDYMLDEFESTMIGK